MDRKRNEFISSRTAISPLDFNENNRIHIGNGKVTFFFSQIIIAKAQQSKENITISSHKRDSYIPCIFYLQINYKRLFIGSANV